MPDEDVSIDMDAALANMDADFAQDSSGAEPAEEPSPSAPMPAAPAATAPAQPAAADPWRAPPKAWKQEMHPHYGALPPQVMQYLHQREKEALDGLMQYKTPLDEYNKTFDQYKPWFEHYKVKPMEVFTRLANSHIALMGQGVQPEVRQKYLDALIQDYGLEPLLRQMYGAPTQGQPPQIDPAVQQLLQSAIQPLQQKLSAFEQQQQAQQQARQEEELAEINKEIDSFLASPENEFAKEVLQDMVGIINAGLATTLKEAYEAAIWHNPATRQKLMEREMTKAAKPQRPPLRTVRSGNGAQASTKPSDGDDMDATMARVLKEINSRA